MKKVIFSLSMLFGISLGFFCPSVHAMQNLPVANVSTNKTWASTCVIGGLWLAWTLGPVIKGLFFDNDPHKEDIVKELTKEHKPSIHYYRANKIVQKNAKKMGINDVTIRCIVSDASFTKKIPGFTTSDIGKFIKNNPNVQVSDIIRNFFSSQVIMLSKSMVKKISKEELSFIISHELAHIKNNDILIGLKRKFVLLGMRGLCGALFIPSVIYSNNSMGARALLGLQGFLLSNSLLDGVDNYFSRQQEKRADLMAVATVGTSDGAIKSFDKFRQKNLSLVQDVKNGVIKDQARIQLIELGIDEYGNDIDEPTHPLLAERIAYCKAACPV